MSPELVGALMLVTLIGAICVGFPIAFTLLVVTAVFGLIGFGWPVFDLMMLQTIGLAKEQVFAAVPLFIFMGYMTEQAGLMERLFRAFQLLLAPVRGSLYLVGASVTVLGIMAGSTMVRSGYDIRLSAGVITAGGTLGILIPPSVMLIVMGPVLGVSVVKLYAAAFGPGFLLYPGQLSGGMQQRVSLSRVLVYEPDLLLMDEPFGALDEFTRERLNLEIQRIWIQNRKTILFVTHNIAEAVFLSDQVLVMTPRPGRLARVVRVPFPRPREIRLMKSPDFASLFFEIREVLGVA